MIDAGENAQILTNKTEQSEDPKSEQNVQRPRPPPLPPVVKKAEAEPQSDAINNVELNRNFDIMDLSMSNQEMQNNVGFGLPNGNVNNTFLMDESLINNLSTNLMNNSENPLNFGIEGMQPVKNEVDQFGLGQLSLDSSQGQQPGFVGSNANDSIFNGGIDLTASFSNATNANTEFNNQFDFGSLIPSQSAETQNILTDPLNGNFLAINPDSNILQVMAPSETNGGQFNLKDVAGDYIEVSRNPEINQLVSNAATNYNNLDSLFPQVDLSSGLNLSSYDVTPSIFNTDQDNSKQADEPIPSRNLEANQLASNAAASYNNLGSLFPEVDLNSGLNLSSYDVTTSFMNFDQENNKRADDPVPSRIPETNQLVNNAAGATNYNNFDSLFAEVGLSSGMNLSSYDATPSILNIDQENNKQSDEPAPVVSDFTGASDFLNNFLSNAAVQNETNNEVKGTGLDFIDSNDFLSNFLGTTPASGNTDGVITDNKTNGLSFLN